MAYVAGSARCMSNIAFSEARLPTYFAYGSSFGPCFSTHVVRLEQSAEQRNLNWQQDLPHGEISYHTRSLSEIQALHAFYHARRGAAQGFRVKWHLDYAVTNQLLAIGDGTTQTFPFLRWYLSGLADDTYTRRLYKIVGVGYPIGNAYDSVQVFTDGSPLLSGYNVNYTQGLLNFGTAPPTGVQISASFEYDWPMRFASNAFLTSLQAILTRAAVPLPAPAPPHYLEMADASAQTWYYYIDTRGAPALFVSPPPSAPFVALWAGTTYAWMGVSDETGAQKFLYPDLRGELLVDTVQPAGTGINYNAPVHALAGPQLVGEDGRTRYTIAADTANAVYVYHQVLDTTPPPFDALGQTDSIPLIGVRDL